MVEEPSTPPPELDALARRVIEVIAKEGEIATERISLDTTFEELGFDSLDGINLAFALEEAFDVRIPDEAVRLVRDVRHVVANLRPLVGGAGTE